MENQGQRAQIVKLSGARCGRSGSGGALLVVVGKQTKECSYRTPLSAATWRSPPPRASSARRRRRCRARPYLALNLRSGGGSRYQLAVYPKQDKAQMRKILSDGSIVYLAIEKNVEGIEGIGKANELRLRAFNVTEGAEKGDCHILAYVGGKLVADVTDEGAGELSGQASGFSVGSAKIAKGAQASFDDVVVRVPNPF